MNTKPITINKKSMAVFSFTLLIYLSGFVSIIPHTIGITQSAGYPIVLQNMICVLAGILLGGPQGAAAVGLFLMFGALGLPVFSSTSFLATQGMERLTGPTGGFIIGYFLAAAVAGFILGPPTQEKPSIKKLIKAVLVGFALIYLVGIINFLSVKGFSLSIQNVKTVFTSLVLPYLPFDVIKIISTVLIAYFFRPSLTRIIFSPTNTV